MRCNRRWPADVLVPAVRVSKTTLPTRPTMAYGSTQPRHEAGFNSMNVNQKAESDEIEVLLVDDRPDNLLTLEAVLSSPGVTLFRATSGEKALRYLLDREPAVILMDVQMPGLDGFETASIIKGCERTREIPIIFLTAINTEEAYVQRGYEHGAVDYIYKPYDPRILRSKVGVFVDLARKTRRLLRAEKLVRESEIAEREHYINLIELRNLRREKAEQRRYRGLVEGISQGIVWVADPDARIFSFISPSVRQVLGESSADLAREPEFLTRRVVDEDRAAWLDALRRTRVPGFEPVQLEHRVRSSRGEPIWLRTTMRLEKDSECEELRGLSMDINALKVAEETLRRNKDRSDFLAEASRMLSESLDLETAISRLSGLIIPRFADWHGIRGHEPKESGAMTLLAGHGEARILGQVTESDLRGIARSDEELENFREMGIRSAIVAPIPFRAGIFGIMVFLSSNAHRKYDQADLSVVADLARRVGAAMDNSSLYQQAQAAVRIRDEFLSIASHELKTPLTPLKMQIQILLRLLRDRPLSTLPQEKVNRMLEVAERQVEKLSSLVDDLLDVSRIANGKLSLDLEEFDFGEMVREVVERFCPPLDGGRCDVRIEVETTGAIAARLDRFRMEQVVVNLLTNALKYGNNLPIRLMVEATGERIRLAVRDQGVGVSSDDRERIFGRFERAVAGSSQGGLGLGLYIVNQIVQSHGGKVELVSDVGQGSTFIVTLPARLPATKGGHDASVA